MRISTTAIIASFALLLAAGCGEAAGADLLDSNFSSSAASTFNPTDPDDPNQNPEQPGTNEETATSCQQHSQCPSGSACVSGSCNQVDYAFVTLSWEGSESQPVNLDLHVEDPSGNHIYWRSTQGGSHLGAFADHPECISFDCQGKETHPSESIYWPIRQMEPGEYKVWVENASEAGKTFLLEVQAGDKPIAFSNTVAGGGATSPHIFRIEEEAQERGDGPCYQELRDRGVDFEEISISEGSSCTVEDAVMINTPIAGVMHRYVASTSTTRLRTSCEMAHKLIDLSEMLAARGVTEVFHGGSYKCRNIANSNTPSQHSLARAYDIHSYTVNGVRADYEDHWEHDTDNPQTERGQILYDITHAIYDARIFNTVITADYNSNHDNHIHVDFTGSNRLLEAQRELPTYELDPHEHDHACPADL